MSTKLGAIQSPVLVFYRFHHRHGRGPGDLLVTWRTGQFRNRSWQPMLAHLGPRAERWRLIRLGVGGRSRRRLILSRLRRSLMRAVGCGIAS